jgi:hypothetical protein
MFPFCGALRWCVCCATTALTASECAGGSSGSSLPDKKVLQQAYMQRSILHNEAGNKELCDADALSAAAYGSSLARIMTSEVRRRPTRVHSMPLAMPYRLLTLTHGIAMNTTLPRAYTLVLACVSVCPFFVCTYANVNVSLNACTSQRVHVGIRLCVFTCEKMSVCAHVCSCVSRCAYMQ